MLQIQPSQSLQESQVLPAFHSIQRANAGFYQTVDNMLQGNQHPHNAHTQHRQQWRCVQSVQKNLQAYKAASRMPVDSAHPTSPCYNRRQSRCVLSPLPKLQYHILPKGLLRFPQNSPNDLELLIEHSHTLLPSPAGIRFQYLLARLLSCTETSHQKQLHCTVLCSYPSRSYSS